MKNLVFVCLAAAANAFFASAAIASEGTSSRGSLEEQVAQELDWIEPEQQQRVADAARAGAPRIKRNARDCDSEHDLNDRVGVAPHSICLTQIKLPAEVRDEVLRMQSQRFRCVSDYDQRVTHLYAFKHHGLFSELMTDAELQEMASAFGVPAETIRDISLSFLDGDDFGYLDRLVGLMIDDQIVEQTKVYQYTFDLFEGSSLSHATVRTNEITLYPGGGFNVAYQFIFDGTYVVFVKYEWWNS